MRCSSCGAETKLHSTFGKLKCRPCIDKAKTGFKGNSGMVYSRETRPQMEMLFDNKELDLLRIPKSDKLFVKWYYEHYPQSKGIVGRSLNYKILFKGKPVGIISGASPPRNYKLFRAYFNTEDDLCFLNNNVFRIVEHTGDKNLGTKVLKLFRQALRIDYKDKYDTILHGIVTFVEPPRSGAIYKADNWENLGMTQGISVRRRGEDWFEKTYVEGTKKHIYAYRYKKKEGKHEKK